MPKEIMLEKYANLIVKKGINLSKGQLVNIKVNIENYEFARRIARVCYENGASDVYFSFIDNYAKKLEYLYKSDEKITEVPSWQIERAHYMIDNDMASIAISSPDPNAFKGIDSEKIQKSNRATNEKLSFLRDYTMNSIGQWLVVGVPTVIWAKQVYPDMTDSDAVEALWEKIFYACRITEDNDPIAEWDKHIEFMHKKAEFINSLKLKSLVFKNKLGTDLEVGIADDCIFTACGEHTEKGRLFVANMPTEECWGMPHKLHVNGHVVATKPLIYEGNTIDKFNLTFKDGKVVDYKAEVGMSALKSLIEFDEGSSSIGEVSLVPFKSPISDLNMLFYSTLYDENASCHLALGRAYSTNIIGGQKMSLEELAKRGANYSNVHVDFMFGSDDMEVVGKCADGKSVKIFENGNYII